MEPEKAHTIAIIGAGFTGLSAALQLARQGYRVKVFEADDAVGGLAGSFKVGPTRLEKFYHHWFTNDKYVTDLVRGLGCENMVVHRATETGSYYANKVFRLSSPLDLLKYTPISLYARIRLGLLVISARLVRDWKQLESITAYDWIRKMAGKEVLEKVWQPLLIGKFGRFSDKIAAVWFWNKLVLRGGSRASSGKEVLAYYQGGFGALADKVCEEIRRLGGEIHLNSKVTALSTDNNQVTGVTTEQGEFQAGHVICTTPLPIFASLVSPLTSELYVEQLNKIQYLGNTCLTLELNRSLSNTYWINITDPSFPFVGIIEHTNFEPKEHYGGKHIVYLSKYLPTDDPLYQMDKQELLEYSIPHLQKMFPEFDHSWVENCHIYKAQYSQPLVEKNYSSLIPEHKTPLKNLYLATMAQIYPEDRGTNYAIREGFKIADLLIRDIKK